MHRPESSTAIRRRQRLVSAFLAVCAAPPLALTATTQPAAAASLDTWDRVASCESSGNWSINTGNGFYGGLQFTASTWAEFGGQAFAPNAHLATKEQQIAIAEKVLEGQGPGAWPVCSVKAGLNRGSDAPQEEMPTPDTGTTPPDDIPRPAAVSVSASAGTGSVSARLQAWLPVSGGTISTPYRQAGSWAAGFHTGVDFAVPAGTAVFAVAPGTVISAGWQGAYGNAVVIQHDDGMYSLYAHLSTASLAEGERVTAGQRIGLSGSTGNSTGPHLHFEVRTSNSYAAHIDPLAYLRGLGLTI
ncbi:transglycosylase family protein [Streptomyces sp. SKN60]|uniref:transglycosylase family protein n=1 Tax=Streptomyces sp. SKN60 TaxID=2855506 RepID=UPI0022465797|nr:transglycosylase family protein [Streptomyces sp. SKN60]MCX2185780.1 transglycosylase family protein [Streptomyces sp. SKN60]